MKASFHKFTAALFAACLFTLFACSGDDGGSSVVYGPTVGHGGETYQTVVIGTQTWFARNSNYDVNGSKCYNNEPSNCTTYGRLYNWETAMMVCPSGWHLPTDAEWETLINYAGIKKLKAKGGWSNSNGTDDYGFSALPGGFGNVGGVVFDYVGSGGSWWSASVNNDGSAYYWSMGYYSVTEGRSSTGKSYLFSVRCVS